MFFLAQTVVADNESAACLSDSLSGAACAWGPVVLALVVGYFLGSILFAVPVARRCGVDIFKVGSGNPGATNVKRAVGKIPGNIVFACDALKGLVAALWPVFFFAADMAVYAQIAGFAGALIGHSFSCYYRFRGGKAVSTTIGGLLAIMPLAVLPALLLWVIVFYFSGYVSLASLFLGLALPLAAWLLELGTPRVILGAVVCVLLFVRHRSNIARLLNGTESRFSRKKK